MDLTHAQGKQNLYDYVQAMGEEHGVNIDRVRVNTAGPIRQNQVLIEKQIGEDTYMKHNLTVDDNPDLEDADPKFDAVAQEFEMVIRNIKNKLTDIIEYNGHRFEFYPYDDGKAHCMRCDEELEMPLGMRDYGSAWVGDFETVEHKEMTFTDTRNRNYTRPRVCELMKRYVHGWAIEYPCDEVIERKEKSMYYDP